jgi:hypothetical protein
MTRDADHSPPPGRRATRPDPDRSDDGAPVLPSVSSDEVDLGWGDEPSGRDEDWYRRERPPHHES